MSVLRADSVLRAHGVEAGLAGRLEPAGRPALLVVDLIRGFTDPSCGPGFDLDDVVARTARLLEAARRWGRPVVFTTIAYTPEELAETLWLQKMPALSALAVGSHWVDVDDRVAPFPGDPVVVKKAASAFAGTALDRLLRSHEVGSLVVAGATTSGCVRATAVDACSLGWPTFVAAECVGDRAAAPHASSLLDIDAKYADVVDLATALSILGPRGTSS